MKTYAKGKRRYVKHFDVLEIINDLNELKDPNKESFLLDIDKNSSSGESA